MCVCVWWAEGSEWNRTCFKMIRGKIFKMQTIYSAIALRVSDCLDLTADTAMFNPTRNQETSLVLQHRSLLNNSFPSTHRTQAIRFYFSMYVTVQ